MTHKTLSGPACDSALKPLEWNELAFLDLWVAINAERFVGTKASSFSGGATIARSLRGNTNRYVEIRSRGTLRTEILIRGYVMGGLAPLWHAPPISIHLASTPHAPTPPL